MTKIIFSLLTILVFCAQAQSVATKPYKGNAILGNGNICLVYSDDARIKTKSGNSGIQHYYYQNYTVDYLRGCEIKLFNSKKNVLYKVKTTVTGMQNFYKTSTTSMFENGPEIVNSCFVHQNDVTTLQFLTKKSKPGDLLEISILYRKLFISDLRVSLTNIKLNKNSATLYWDNSFRLSIKSSFNTKILKTDSSVVFQIPADNAAKINIYLAPGNDDKEILAKLKLTDSPNFEKTADVFWKKWIEKSLSVAKEKATEDKNLLEFFKRTMYAVKSACLNGMIPADMTGQFVTNNMPQLYPRDAMKSARVFLNLGYKEEARSIIKYWCGAIPQKSKGEFFARYDARCKAVDAGSGARFDEPEWDANGYLVQLLYWYHGKYGEWLAPKELVYELSDFVLSKIDENGLLYEGGIVEWTGYLPTTNMICSAGLSTAAIIASENGDSVKSKLYEAGAKNIADNLFKTYDLEKNTYAAIRFHGVKNDNKSIMEQEGEKLFLWDGTMQFGALWGYPIHPMLQSTIRFYEENIIKPEGGMQYFEALDNGGLSAYGGDLFFFSTAALSQYYSLYESKEKALHQIQWMMNNANIYGLMPERIYTNYSDCSDASPLSWCNAEFAAAVYTYLH